jgi:hypothetical protein
MPYHQLIPKKSSTLHSKSAAGVTDSFIGSRADYLGSQDTSVLDYERSNNYDIILDRPSAKAELQNPMFALGSSKASSFKFSVGFTGQPQANPHWSSSHK